MRTALILLGFVAIASYSIVGAMLMNDWAIVAASEVPLETAITSMNAAGQPYSIVPGIVFAALGISLAVTWVVLNLHPRIDFPHWVSVTVWAGIVTFGAPAFFLTSFANMNNLGDTFYDWNAEAAWALEVPLYLISVAAFLIAVAAVITKILRSAVVAGSAGRSGSPGS